MNYNVTFEDAKRNETYVFFHMTVEEIKAIWEKPRDDRETIAYIEYQDHCIELQIECEDTDDGKEIKFVSYYMCTKNEWEDKSQFCSDDWADFNCTEKVSKFTSWGQLEEDMWNVLNNYGCIPIDLSKIQNTQKVILR